MRTLFAMLTLCFVAGWVYAQEALSLPELEAVPLDGPLAVVATTSIIGDVVARVGGEAIALTTLMGPGQDPHGYQPAARDLATASEAHVVFVNGWDLEETLVSTLESVVEGVPLVPVSAGIVPLEFGGHDEHDEEHEDEEHDEGEEHEGEEHEDHEGEEHDDEEHQDEHDEGEHEGEEHEGEHDEDHDHGGADPHTWLSVANVEQWVANIRQALTALDPANAEIYAANADAYLAELHETGNLRGSGLRGDPSRAAQAGNQPRRPRVPRRRLRLRRDRHRDPEQLAPWRSPPPATWPA